MIKLDIINISYNDVLKYNEKYINNDYIYRY